MPKISVIVPIYNVEKYLRQCLDSIINQTLTDIEIICVNDGSTDNSLDIIKEYANNDTRVKIIDKANAGYGHTMNRGLDTATGEYISIIESDDYAELNMFEDLYNNAKQFDAEIVKSNWFQYFSKKHEINRKMAYLKKQDELRLLNPKQDKFLLSIPPSIWSAIYKREFIKENNINFLETPGASFQDTSFQFKAFVKAEKVILTNNAYIHYRQDSLNSSINNKNKIFCLCDEFEEIEKFLDRNIELKQHFETSKNINMFNCYEWNLNRLDKALQKSFVDKFSKTYKKLFNDENLDDEFFKKISREKIMMLIEKPDKYLKNFRKRQFKEKLSDFRRKLFSIHINKTEINIVLFGKEVVSFN